MRGSSTIKLGIRWTPCRLSRKPWRLRCFTIPRATLNADATAKSTFDDASHTASYEIQIRQGDLFRMGKLALTGLDDGQGRDRFSASSACILAMFLQRLRSTRSL